MTTPTSRPRIILGTSNIGPDPARGARISNLDEVSRAFDVLVARGYPELDTARLYQGGQSEGFSRQAGWKEHGLSLATKVMIASRPGDNAPEKVKQSVETSFRELGTDRVDILYLHNPDRGTPFVDTLRAVDELYKAGKFVRFGLSNFTAFEVAEVCLTCAHHGFVRPAIVEVLYSALARTIEPEFVPCCRRYGLEIVVFNPLAGGLLSGKIKSRDHVPDAGRFSNVTGAGSFYRDRYYRESTFNAVKVIADAVERENADTGDTMGMPEAALRWLVYHSALKTGDAGRDGVILGVSSAKQLEQNIDSIERGPLSESMVEAFERAWEVSRADVCTYWHPDSIEYTYDTQAAVFGTDAAA